MKSARTCVLALAVVLLPIGLPTPVHAQTTAPSDCSGANPPPSCLRTPQVVASDDGYDLRDEIVGPRPVPADYTAGEAPDQDMIEDVAPLYPANCRIVGWDTDPGSTGTPRLACTPEGEADATEEEQIDWAAAMAAEYQRLTLTPSPITYQPSGDWALINVDFIVLTDPAPQLTTTQLFGVDITVRSTPVSFTWDFGDGATLTTSDPGNPYPNQTVAHVYTSAHEGVTISLTTSWAGEFQIAGTDTWTPIAGMATTTSTAGPVEIVAMEVNLVPNPGD